MKKELEKKITYYTGQVDKSTDRFLSSCKRLDRDVLIQQKTKLAVYREILEMMQKDNV